MSGTNGSLTFVADGGPPEGAHIRNALWKLFKSDAEAAGVTSPISDEQKRAWYRFIIPRIESAYGLLEYTHIPERLNNAQNGVRVHGATLYMTPESIDQLVEQIFAVHAPGEGAQ